MNKALVWITVALILVAIFLGITLGTSRHYSAAPYKTFPSPDGKFSIIVYRIPTSFSQPGGSGDAPGFVRLYNSSGKMLEEKAVSMVQIIDQVTWSPNKVEIKLFADWALPN